MRGGSTCVRPRRPRATHLLPHMAMNPPPPLGGPGASGSLGGGSAGLSLSLGSEVPSFRIFNSCFVKDDIAIHSKGVEMRDRTKSFTVAPDELELGVVIGRGFSSYVQHAVHKPTGTLLALKVINAFEKVKRDQLVKEIKTLYDASCTNIVTFYGAFYRDGAISIALEYMDGGSLANVVTQVGQSVAECFFLFSFLSCCGGHALFFVLVC